MMNIMKKDFETNFTGWAFIVAALLLWLGWAFSPHHIGEYIVASDFEAIGESVWTWIWMYRIHIFGWVTMGIALFALVSVTARKPYRVMILPGAGMVIIGTFTLAIANAYFYNFGAWGVGLTAGKSAVEIQAFVNDILYTNQYVTCFIRFGRIFSGVGLVLLGAGFIKWNIISKWMGWFTLILGFAAMAIIMGIPDNYEIYKPIFHVKVVWLILMGVTMLTRGVNLPKSE
jgi:tetrahydromethanopterin S-methyltransferase subunit F